MNKTNNILLAACAAVLALVCIWGVMRPIRFEQQRQEREAAVKTALVTIRQAQERYRKATGGYTASFEKLIKGGYLKNGMQYIPYAGHTPFDLQASAQTDDSGRSIPLMQCTATYKEYLQGLDPDAIAAATEAANNAGRFPGLKIGDITTPNNNAANWE